MRGSKTQVISRMFSLLPFFLFFVSGFCGLVYEVVWSRMLVLVLGNTTLATSSILASFMAGLSLGSWFWGRYIEKHPGRPLSIFGMLEIGIGLMAIGLPLLLRLIVPVEVWLFDPEGWGYLSQVAIRFMMCFLLLIGPTFLMGGTFAVIGQHVIQGKPGFGRNTAVLYGLNTTGAVGGAFLAGFFLIKYLGHTGSLWLAASLSLSVGVTALFVDRRVGRSQVTQALEEDESFKPDNEYSRPSRTVTRLVMYGLALSGFCSLAYQLLWTRLLVLEIDNSVYSFTTILMAFLVGIALGSLITAPAFKYLKHPVLTFAFVEIALGISAFLFPLFIHHRSINVNEPYWFFLLLKMPVVILISTLLMGVTLPLAAHIYKATHGGIGKSLGAVFAVNTVGAVMGAIAAGFFLIPKLGFYASSLLLPGINLTVGGVILTLCITRPFLKAVALASLIVMVGLGVRAMPPEHFSLLYARLEPKSEQIYHQEGMAATVTIFKRPGGMKVLYINGMPEVDNSQLSVKTFKLMGCLPGLLHENSSSALMVTFGAGITAGTAVHFVDRIDCVDLANQAREIARYFKRANNGILEKDGVSIYIDDARHFLQNTRRQYSFIVSDATHPRSYDSWVLFTRQFYQMVRRKLEAGGIFCQWVPFHGLNPSQYMAIIRTFSNVFPHTSIWHIGQAYSLLLATPERLIIDFRSFLRKILQKDVRQDLAQLDLDNPFEILSHFALGEEKVKAMVAEFPEIITDNSPAHLFFPPNATLADQYERWPLLNSEKLTEYTESVIPYLTNISRSETKREKVLEAMKSYERKKKR